MGSSNNLLIDITSIFPIFLLDIVLRLQGEILSWSIMGVKGSVLPPKKHKNKKCCGGKKNSVSATTLFMTSIYSQLFNHLVTSLFGTNTLTSSQLAC